MVRGSPQTGALLVTETIEHGAEAGGGVGADPVGALAENLVAVGDVDVVVSHGDGVGGDLQEGEAGEDLTARGEGEGGAGGHRLGVLCLLLNSTGAGGDCLPPCAGCSTDQFCHHLIHLGVVDGGVIPTDIITSGRVVAVVHAADELGVETLASVGILDASNGGVVEKLVVADPQAGVPGLVVGPAVVGGVGHGWCPLFGM